MATKTNPQQLVLAKQLYDDARILAGREDGLSLMKAVLLLDLSVEQTLNQILRDFDRDFHQQRMLVVAISAGSDYGLARKYAPKLWERVCRTIANCLAFTKYEIWRSTMHLYRVKLKSTDTLDRCQK